MGKAWSRMRGQARVGVVGVGRIGSSFLCDSVDQGCGWVGHGRQQEPGMMDGREYIKRILGVNPPMGRASGPPTGLIRAPASPLMPSLQSASQHPGSSSLLILLAKSETSTIQGGMRLEIQFVSWLAPRENDFASSITFGDAEGLRLTPRIGSTTFTPTLSHHGLASAATAEELPDDTRPGHPGLHIVSPGESCRYAPAAW